MGMFFLGVAIGAVLLLPATWFYGRRAVARSRANERRALDAERLVSTLAGGLAHEIKNPLSTMTLNLQLLAEDWSDADTPEGRRVVRRIGVLQKEAERLADILDDFMRFARADQIELQRCNVNQVLDEVLTFLAPELRAHRIEVLKSFGDLRDSRVDPALLKQAVLNILLNAEQAMEAGGDLLIRTTGDEDWIEIGITDTGVGIEPEELGSIFTAYHSTRKGGTGLGLPTSRRIVEKHGGEIRVHSEPARGSRFTIRLPVRTEAAAEQGNPL